MLVKFTGGGSAQLTLNGRVYLFTPTANVPDREAHMLMGDGEMGRKFVAAGEQSPAVAKPKNPLECDVCGRLCGSLAGLGAHRRKHKERT